MGKYKQLVFYEPFGIKGTFEHQIKLIINDFISEEMLAEENYTFNRRFHYG